MIETSDWVNCNIKCRLCFPAVCSKNGQEKIVNFQSIFIEMNAFIIFSDRIGSIRSMTKTTESVVLCMKATVDRDLCIGCGLCADVCPEVFEMDDESIAVVIVDVIPEAAEESAQEAADSCPVEAIAIED